MAIPQAVLPQPVSWHRYAHLMVVYLVWGSTYFAIRIVLGGGAPISPLMLQTWRMWGAGLLLVAIGFAGTRALPRLSRRDAVLCVVSGIFMWVLGNGLTTLAALHAASAFIVMAMGMIPLWTALLASIASRSLPSPGILAGLFLGLAGLILVFAPPILAATASMVEPGYGLWVAVLLTAAGLTWSLGTLMQRPLLRAVSPVWAGGLQMLSAAAVLTLLAVSTGEDLAPPSAIGLNQIAAFLFLVVFGSAVCLVSYMRVLSSFTPTVASTFAYVNPLVGVALGWLFLGEAPGGAALAGVALILAGVFVVLSQTARQGARR